MAHRDGFTLVELLVALFITAIMFAIGYRGLDQAFTSGRELDQQSARLIAVQQAVRTIEQDFELLQPRPVRQPIGDGYLPAVFSAQTGAQNAPLDAGLTAGSSASLGSSASVGSSSSLGSSTSLGSTGSLGGSTSLGSAASLGSSTSPSSGTGPSSSTSLISSTSVGTSASGGSPNPLGSGLDDTTAPIVTLTRGSWTNPIGLPRSELQRVSYAIENGALVRSYWPVLDATTPIAPVKRTLVDHVKRFSLRYLDAGRTWQTSWPPGTLGTAPVAQTLRLRPVAIELTLELDDWGVVMRYIEVPG